MATAVVVARESAVVAAATIVINDCRSHAGNEPGIQVPTPHTKIHAHSRSVHTLD